MKTPRMPSAASAAARTLWIFAMFTLLFEAHRAVFLAIYQSTIGQGAGESLSALGHGLAMDMSMGGYLTVIPALLTVASTLTARRWTVTVLKVYLAIISALLAAVFVLDLTLYGYWGFRLDSTPLFYFATSPGAAMASVELWQTLLLIAATIVTAVLVYTGLWYGQKLITVTPAPTRRGRIRAATAAIIICAALFIPIRGGVTVSTMNLSRAYFSQNPRLNHAAVNPAFSLLYSLSHQEDIGSQFNYMEPEEAQRIFDGMHSPVAGADTTATQTLSLNNRRPDIYLIILESFSSHIMPSLGGEAIATGLDSIASTGAIWTRFYANSFRTDRALPAVIAGFASQPTLSLMKMVEKAEKVPTLASELKRQGGYETAYYYGGDANFTNMLAFLVSGGFERIISDKDFAISEKLSKWGAHDNLLFERVISELPEGKARPRLTVIQTSSSHEPFEVPYRNTRFKDNDRANSLSFTDSCLTAFYNRANATGRPSLFVFVPDHYGTWPLRDSLKTLEERHRIPLVIAGNALTQKGVRSETPGSQPDIAPTLLALLGLDTHAFVFGNDLNDPCLPHFAWLTEPELIGLIDREGAVTYNIAADRTEDSNGPESEARLRRAKAYLQTLYKTISEL